MVESKSHLQEQLNAAFIKAIEAEFTTQQHNFSMQGEKYEELKNKVKPKLVMVTSALAEAVKILRDFQIKHGAGGKTVFS